MKNTFKLFSLLLIASLCFTALSLTGCGNGTTGGGSANSVNGANGGANGAGGGMGQISIRVSSGARAAWNNMDTDDFTHVITVSDGPGKPQSRTLLPHTGTGVANFTVEAGTWTIKVEASYNGNVVAVGSERKNVKAGENTTVSVKMNAAGGIIIDYPDDGYDYTVTTAADWYSALNVVRGNGSGTIGIINDITVTGSTTGITFSNLTGSITIIGNGKTITLSGTGSLLNIGNNQSVTIENVNLKGNNGNNAPLVKISGLTGTGGALTMNSGSITGNTNTTGNGGGVSVNDGGTFTMNGGTISGNTANVNGGGVFLNSGGAYFTMNGGTISGNSAGSFNEGGGVYLGGNSSARSKFNMTGGEIKKNSGVASGGGVSVYMGDFTMSGGTIYGTDDPNNTNTATNGASLLLSNGTAKYGNGDDIIPSGGDRTDNTIKGHQ